MATILCAPAKQGYMSTIVFAYDLKCSLYKSGKGGSSWTGSKHSRVPQNKVCHGNGGISCPWYLVYGSTQCECRTDGNDLSLSGNYKRDAPSDFTMSFLNSKNDLCVLTITTLSIPHMIHSVHARN